MYVVTGGAGFIGSNIVKALNSQGIKDILVVDDLTDGTKFKNIVNCEILDYLDKDDFLNNLSQEPGYCIQIKAVLHQGACSETTEWNGRYMMKNNYEYSKQLFHTCLTANIPFIYASSAAVYGLTTIFKEVNEYENPLNVYGYSKLQFDNYVRRYLDSADSQVVGLRYFNVFGPGEQHKGKMASVIFHFYNQLKQHGKVNLFEGCEGYKNGEQQRDFIYVDDIVKINLWFLNNPNKSGIYNVGTSCNRSFNDVANNVINYFKKGSINYIPFPDHLKGYYQSFTKADISLLKEAGYLDQFHTLEEGINKYLEYLSKTE